MPSTDTVVNLHNIDFSTGRCRVILASPWIVSVGRVLVYIQVKNHLSRLSTRDVANQKPYVFSLSGAQIVAQGIVSVNVGGEKTGSKKMNSIESSVFVPGFFVLPAF